MSHEKNILTIEIDGTTYIVSTHFSTGEETLVDKLARLVSEDENIAENPMI